MHFWYPPQLIPVVEVCGAPETGPDVVAWACDAVRACGKKPAVIEREIPGFIGNRLQFALLREAWALWASGAATAESIDACVRLTIGRRLGVTGPIESADIAGLETMLAFAEGLQPHLDVAPLPPRAIGDVAKRGGIYDWEKRDAGALRAARTEELFRWLEVDRQG
jgi:3-hydroxybutyryl-CoA dehydrogenase